MHFGGMEVVVDRPKIGLPAVRELMKIVVVVDVEVFVVDVAIVVVDVFCCCLCCHRCYS